MEFSVKKLKNLASEKRSVITLVGGTSIAQGLSLLFAPATTRLFSPDVFGELSVFTSITSIIIVIICLRYELSIVVADDDEEAILLLRVSFIFAFMLTVLFGVPFSLLRGWIFNRLDAKGLAQYWYYFPVTLFLAGIVQSSNYWLIRNKKYKLISISTVVSVVVSNFVSIGLGLLGFVDVGSRLLANTLGYIANILLFSKEIAPVFTRDTDLLWEQFKKIIAKYKNSLLYDTGGTLLNNISWIIVPILMNIYYSSNAAGQYSIGMRIIQIPISIIGTSISRVFLQSASERLRRHDLYRYSLSVMKKMFIYTIFPTIVLFLFGKQIFHFVFGSKWDLAGIYCQILAPWALLWFCVNPIHGVFTITKKQNSYLLFSILNLATRFLSLYIGKKLGSDSWGLILFSISGIIAYSYSLFLALAEAKKSDRNVGTREEAT